MYSIKQFWGNSVLYGLGSVIIRTISFFLLPLYTNVFSQSETGYIFLLFTFIAFTQIIFDYGQDSAFLQYYKNDSANKDSVACTSIIMLLITSIIFSIIIVLFADLISNVILRSDQYIWVILCSGIIFFDVISSRMMTLIRIQERSLKYLTINLLNVSSTLLLTYLMVIHYHLRIYGVLIGILLGTIIRFLILLPSQIKIIKKGKFSFVIYQKLLRFGLPFFPAAFFYLIIEMSDRYLLFWISGTEAVGVYSIGYKIGSLALFIIIAFNLGWQPFYIKTGNKKNSEIYFGKIGTIFLHLLIILWGLIVLWTPVLIKIKIGESYLIGREFWGAEQIIAIIFLSYLFYAGYIILMPSIYLLEKQIWSPIFIGIGAIVNIICNIIFINYWGFIGAAYATLIAYMFMFFIIYYKSIQWMKIKCNWKNISVHLFFTAIYILFYMMTKKTLIMSACFTFIYISLLYIFQHKIKLISSLIDIKSSFNNA